MPYRILVVDDHEIVRLGIRTLFANDDSIEVCGESENGWDAVRMVSDLLPDVVILDLTMPEMNGFEAAEKMLLIAPSVRIVFFSAHEIPVTARLVGANAFVSKSSALSELTSAVRCALQTSKDLGNQRKSLSAANSSNR